jgi:hypothetical protein
MDSIFGLHSRFESLSEENTTIALRDVPDAVQIPCEPWFVSLGPHEKQKWTGVVQIRSEAKMGIAEIQREKVENTKEVWYRRIGRKMQRKA